METTANTKKDQGAPDDIICACMNFRRSDMHAFLAANPTNDFDLFLRETDIGHTCTACLLDLEYEFVTFDFKTAAKPHARSKTAKDKAAGRPLFSKQRFYTFLDRLSPRVSVPLEEVLPVLAGNGFSQRLLITNQSLLYAGELCAPTMNVEIVVRDGDGKVRSSMKHAVKAGETFEQELSPLIADDTEEALQIGSVKIRRFASEDGFRGTTRPQTELIGPGGASAVHGQAARHNSGGEVTFGPLGSARAFISFVNDDEKPITLSLRYPLPLWAEPQDGPIRSDVVIPAHGTRLVEIAPPDQSTGDTPSLCRVSWRGAGKYKAHVFNADADLTRLSIDHN